MALVDSYEFIIGIDPGVVTGYAVWNGDELFAVSSDKIHKVMELVKSYYAEYEILVRMEDARKRTWFGKKGRGELQGAGSIKRDCKIWEDFFIDNNIPYELVAPKNNKTKMNAALFAKVTGWKGPTNEHSRDAGMLVYGYCTKNKINFK